jgi:hypothetical protein
MARPRVEDKAKYRGKYYYNNKDWEEIKEISKKLNVTPLKFIKWCVKKEILRQHEKEKRG